MREGRRWQVLTLVKVRDGRLTLLLELLFSIFLVCIVSLNMVPSVELEDIVLLREVPTSELEGIGPLEVVGWVV